MLDFFIVNMYEKIDKYLPTAITSNVNKYVFDAVVSAAAVATLHFAMPKSMIIASVSTNTTYQLEPTETEILDDKGNKTGKRISRQTRNIQDCIYIGFGQDILSVQLKMLSNSSYLSFKNFLNIIKQNFSLSFFEWTIMINGNTWTRAVLSGISTSESNTTNALDYQLTFSLSAFFQKQYIDQPNATTGTADKVPDVTHNSDYNNAKK